MESWQLCNVVYLTGTEFCIEKICDSLLRMQSKSNFVILKVSCLEKNYYLGYVSDLNMQNPFINPMDRK